MNTASIYSSTAAKRIDRQPENELSTPKLLESYDSMGKSLNTKSIISVHNFTKY